MKKKKIGRPTLYRPEYAEKIVDFFSPPYFIYKDMTITKSDGTQIDKTEMEALPPVFLSDFARSIGMALSGYRNTFKLWAQKHSEFSHALKVVKELEVERIRVNATMGLYTQSFSIFTLKNIAGWRDRQENENEDIASIKTALAELIKNHQNGKEKETNEIRLRALDRCLQN